MKDAFLWLENNGHLQMGNPYHLGACQAVGMPLLQHGCDNIFNWWNFNVRLPPSSARPLPLVRAPVRCRKPAVRRG